MMKSRGIVKIKRRGEVVVELDANEADELRHFLYRVSNDPEFYYYDELLNNMYQKINEI